MLKDNGKKKKYIKCDSCKQRFEITEEDIIKMNGISYIECPYCGLQVILKKQ